MPRRSKTKEETERLMVIDYWRRVFLGERDPLRGMLRRFGLPHSFYSENFFVYLGIFEMSETRH